MSRPSTINWRRSLYLYNCLLLRLLGGKVCIEMVIRIVDVITIISLAITVVSILVIDTGKSIWSLHTHFDLLSMVWKISDDFVWRFWGRLFEDGSRVSLWSHRVVINSFLLHIRVFVIIVFRR
jgi:hypothetical protein